MICPTCGKEYEGETCPLCASLKTEHIIADALGSGWFTAVCVMATVSLGLSLLSCTIDVIGILATIFLWILYRDGQNFEFVGKHVRWLSGLVYAMRIILWVVAGLIALVGLFDSYRLLLSLQKSNAFSRYQTLFGEITAEMILFVCLAVAAVLVLMNFLLYRSIHRFVKSVYQSDEYFAKPPVKPGRAAICMAVLGALNLLSVLSAETLFGALDTLCTAGAFLCGAWLVKVYFVKKDS